MTLEVINGNIFTSQAQTLVNTVNCEGVMGAGIALECRLRYPAMYERYQALCSQGLLTPGKLWLYRAHDRQILNFPTKLGWKHNSQWQYLESGADNLLQTYAQRGINSIALPLLGADKGGLSAEEVILWLQRKLAPLATNIDIEIYRYDAKAHDDLFIRFQNMVNSYSVTQLQQMTDVTAKRLISLHEACNSGEIAQINQLANVPGIGLKTLEKVFMSCMTNDAPQDSLF